MLCHGCVSRERKSQWCEGLRPARLTQPWHRLVRGTDFDLFAAGESVSIEVPLAQVLTPVAVGEFGVLAREHFDDALRNHAIAG